MSLCRGAGKQGIARCSSTGSSCQGGIHQHGQRSASRPWPAAKLRPGPFTSSPYGRCCTSGLLPPQVAACACSSACARLAEATQGIWHRCTCLVCCYVLAFMHLPYADVESCVLCVLHGSMEAGCIVDAYKASQSASRGTCVAHTTLWVNLLFQAMYILPSRDRNLSCCVCGLLLILYCRCGSSSHACYPQPHL